MEELEEGGARATVEATFDGPDSATIGIAGELDLSNVLDVEATLSPTLDQARARVAFDLTGLTFMDSSGIAMLLRASERTDSVEVRNASETVRTIIRATGLSEVLHLEP